MKAYLGGEERLEGSNMQCSSKLLIFSPNLLLAVEGKGSLENISTITDGCDLNLPTGLSKIKDKKSTPGAYLLPNVSGGSRGISRFLFTYQTYSQQTVAC